MQRISYQQRTGRIPPLLTLQLSVESKNLNARK